MVPAGVDGGVLPVGRGCLPAAVGAPAGDGAVGAQPARMQAAGGDGGVLPVGRGCPPIEVGAPAGDGAVGAQPARIARAGGDGGVLPVGRGCPPIVVVAPAGDGAVGAQRARMAPAGVDGGVPAGGLAGGLGRGEDERGAGEPVAGGGGGGEEADAGQLSVAPGVVCLALLEAELDAAAFEFARHDAHRADREVQRGAGEPVAGGGGGGEEADAGQLSVAPGVALALLEAELDAAARRVCAPRCAPPCCRCRRCPPGRRQRWRRRRCRGRRAGRRSPRRRGACYRGGCCPQRARSSSRVVTSWRAPVLIGPCPSTSQAGAARQTLHTRRTLHTPDYLCASGSQTSAGHTAAARPRRRTGR